MQKPTATIAQRIFRFSTNLLATGLILVMAVTFGRHAVQWWREDASVAVSPDAVADSVRPAVPQSHASTTMASTRGGVVIEEFTGDTEQAARRMLKMCVETAKLLDRPGKVSPPAAGPAQRRFLALLAESGDEPVRTLKNGCDIYQRTDGPMLLTVAVVEQRPERHNTNTAVGGESAKKEVTATPRVLSWIVGIPRSRAGTKANNPAHRRWLLAASTPDRTAGAPHAPNFPVGFPPETAITFVQDAADGGMSHATVPQSVEEVQQWYDRTFDELGWSMAGPWRRSGHLAVRQFENDQKTITIQVSPAPGGATSVMAVASKAEKAANRAVAYSPGQKNTRD